jgi:hypothetical protein
MADLSIPAPAQPMFGKDWWNFPLPARFHSTVSAESGLRVTVENTRREAYRDTTLCIVWRGTEAQFRAVKYFSKKPCSFPRRSVWASPDQLRGTLHREGADEFRFVIECCGEVSRGC